MATEEIHAPGGFRRAQTPEQRRAAIELSTSLHTLLEQASSPPAAPEAQPAPLASSTRSRGPGVADGLGLSSEEEIDEDEDMVSPSPCPARSCVLLHPTDAWQQARAVRGGAPRLSGAVGLQDFARRGGDSVGHGPSARGPSRVDGGGGMAFDAVQRPTASGVFDRHRAQWETEDIGVEDLDDLDDLDDGPEEDDEPELVPEPQMSNAEFAAEMQQKWDDFAEAQKRLSGWADQAGAKAGVRTSLDSVARGRSGGGQPAVHGGRGGGRARGGGRGGGGRGGMMGRGGGRGMGGRGRRPDPRYDPRGRSADSSDESSSDEDVRRAPLFRACTHALQVACAQAVSTFADHGPGWLAGWLAGVGSERSAAADESAGTGSGRGRGHHLVCGSQLGRGVFEPAQVGPHLGHPRRPGCRAVSLSPARALGSLGEFTGVAGVAARYRRGRRGGEDDGRRVPSAESRYD